MRKHLVTAAAAAILLGGALLAPANAMTPAGLGLLAAGDQVGGIERVARVCRERCSDGFCKKVCRSDRDDSVGFVERRRFDRDRFIERDRFYDGERRFRDRERPGVRLEFD